MFITGLKENSAQEVRGIDAKTGATLIDFLYEGELEITRDNAVDLLVASGMLLLEALQEEVGSFLANNVLQRANLVEMMNLASLHCPGSKF
jgi:hypothetical protein